MWGGDLGGGRLQTGTTETASHSAGLGGRWKVVNPSLIHSLSQLYKSSHQNSGSRFSIGSIDIYVVIYFIPF